MAHSKPGAGNSQLILEEPTPPNLPLSGEELCASPLTRGDRGGLGFTLHPSPFTLHPSPFTLHPSPFTLPPSPSPLQSPPFTLHPSPFTLHPSLLSFRPLAVMLPHTMPNLMSTS